MKIKIIKQNGEQMGNIAPFEHFVDLFMPCDLIIKELKEKGQSDFDAWGFVPVTAFVIEG